MTPTATQFNPEMLALARARARLSQSALASMTGISQPLLSKLELGVREPKPTEIARMAAALDVPTSFFARPESERFIAVPPLFRLQRKRVPKSAIDQLNAEMQSRAMHLREMLRSVDVSPALPMPRSREGDTPEIMADRVRSAWLIRPGPIPNLTALIEAAGIFVVELDAPLDEFEGAAFSAPTLPKMIFVKREQSPDRRRFTLAHELGHLLLHDTSDVDVEREAHQFAQSLLMPSSYARELIGRRPNLPQLRRIKREWRISIAALIMIASHHGLISASQKARLYQQMTIYGWRANEPEELAPERPKLYLSILKTMTGALGYSTVDLAKAIGELPVTVERWYGVRDVSPTSGASLRLV